MTHLLFVVIARPFLRRCRPLRCPRMLDRHFCFFLVTAGAYVYWCRLLRHLCTFCFCATCHYIYLPVFRLQRRVGGLLCFFLNTSFPCNCTRKPFCGDKALKARAPFGECVARPGGLCAVALGCTWFRPPAGTAFSLSGFVFTVVT